MKRAEKRRLEREKSRAQATYTLTQAQIDQMKKRYIAGSNKTRIFDYAWVPVTALRDEFDFGKKRLSRFLEKVLDIYEAYDSEHITLEDLHETINKETGVKISGRLPK